MKKYLENSLSMKKKYHPREYRGGIFCHYQMGFSKLNPIFWWLNIPPLLYNFQNAIQIKWQENNLDMTKCPANIQKSIEPEVGNSLKSYWINWLITITVRITKSFRILFCWNHYAKKYRFIWIHLFLLWTDR